MEGNEERIEGKKKRDKLFIVGTWRRLGETSPVKVLLNKWLCLLKI